MRIALSAYQSDYPEIQEILHSCDLIFTTNVMNRDKLYDLFGISRVKFIPDATEVTMEWLKSRFPEAEFITYQQLFRVRNGHSCHHP